MLPKNHNWGALTLKGRIRNLLVRILLLPIMPCFMWGPFTHPYISIKALEKAKRDPNSVGCKDVLESIESNKDIFVYASNAPDAISTFHVLKNMMVYDYAHTYIPDCPEGRPTFGYRLLDEALTRLEKAPTASLRRKYKREVAFACGWLSHQLADRVPHYQETSSPYLDVSGRRLSFQGYCNSHQVLTPCFYPDVLRAKQNVEHAIIELFHDAYVLITDKPQRFPPGKNHVELLTEFDSDLLTEVSAKFRENWRCRIDSRHLPTLKRDFDAVIRGTDCLIAALRVLQPKFDDMIRGFIRERESYMDQSVEDVTLGVFCASREQISEEAAYSCPVSSERDMGVYVSVVSPKKESILQRLAFQIGRHLNPADVNKYLRKALKVSLPIPLRAQIMLRLCAGWPIKVSTAATVKEVVLPALKRAIDKSEWDKALFGFIYALVTSDAEDILDAARREYCSGLLPIVTLDCDPELLERKGEEKILEDMVRARRIRFRFTPARRTDKDTSDYYLDPSTVDVRINGYSCDDEHKPFQWSITQDAEYPDILKGEARLPDSLPTGDSTVIHIFAEICDNRGKKFHSPYITRQVKVQ